MVLCGVEYNRPYKFNPWGAKELPAASRSPPTTVMGQIMEPTITPSPKTTTRSFFKFWDKVLSITLAYKLTNTC